MSRSGSDNSFNSEASLTTPFIRKGQDSSDAPPDSDHFGLATRYQEDDLESGRRDTTPGAQAGTNQNPSLTGRFGTGGDVITSNSPQPESSAGDRTGNTYCMDLDCITTAFSTCKTGTAEFFYTTAGKLDIHGRHNIGKLAGLILVTIGCVSGAVAIEIFKAAHTAVDAGNGRRLASGAFEAGFTAVNGIADIAHPAKFLGGMAKAAHIASPYVLKHLLGQNVSDISNTTQFLNAADLSSGDGATCTNPAEDSNTWGTELLAFINKVVKSDHQEMSAISWIALGAGVVALLACAYGLYQCFKPKANQETDEAKEKALALPSTAQKIAIWTTFNTYVGMTLQLTTTVLVSTYLGEGYYHDWNDMLNDILKYYECLDIPVTSAIYNSSVQTASQYIFHKFIHKVDNYLEDTTGAGVEWGYPLAFLPLATPFIISGMIMGTQWLAMKALTSTEVARLDHALNKMEVETYYGGFALEERRRLALIGNNLEKYKRIYAEHYETVEKIVLTGPDTRERTELHRTNTGLVDDLLDLLNPEIVALHKKGAHLTKTTNKGDDAPETIAAKKRLKELTDERDRLASRKGDELDQQIKDGALDRAQARNALEEDRDASHAVDFPLVHHEVNDDGNCLFAAVARQAINPDTTTNYTHEDLRAMTVARLRAIQEGEALDPVSVITDGDIEAATTEFEANYGHLVARNIETNNDYLDAMASDGTWGGQLEITAMSELLQRPVRVFREDSAPYVTNAQLYTAERPYINLFHNGRHYEYFQLLTEAGLEQFLTAAADSGDVVTYSPQRGGFESRTADQTAERNQPIARRMIANAQQQLRPQLQQVTAQIANTFNTPELEPFTQLARNEYQGILDHLAALAGRDNNTPHVLEAALDHLQTRTSNLSHLLTQPDGQAGVFVYNYNSASTALEILRATAEEHSAAVTAAQGQQRTQLEATFENADRLGSLSAASAELARIAREAIALARALAPEQDDAAEEKHQEAEVVEAETITVPALQQLVQFEPLPDIDMVEHVRQLGPNIGSNFRGSMKAMVNGFSYMRTVSLTFNSKITELRRTLENDRHINPGQAFAAYKAIMEYGVADIPNRETGENERFTPPLRPDNQTAHSTIVNLIASNHKQKLSLPQLRYMHMVATSHGALPQALQAIQQAIDTQSNTGLTGSSASSSMYGRPPPGKGQNSALNNPASARRGSM